jgi:phenylacetate-CoA ligase
VGRLADHPGGAPGIAARQAARLDALVVHARSTSPFYADHYGNVPDGPVGTDGLRRLPPVSKSALMARFDEWVTDPAITRAGTLAFVADPANVGRDFLGRYVVFTSSGSTGVPALLVQDRRSIAVMTALSYVRSSPVMTPALLARILTRGARQAVVFASGGHFLSTTMFERRLRAAPWRRRMARYFSILDPLPELVGRLNDFQPVLLGTYASALAALTEEQEAGRLKIAPLVITSGGELLLPVVRHRAEVAFGAVVFETYSASEASPLALPCRHGRLHVNSDWFIVEPIDLAGHPVPRGERSDSVLVTNLANHVQPVIRYELGDSVIMDGCPLRMREPAADDPGRGAHRRNPAGAARGWRRSGPATDGRLHGRRRDPGGAALPDSADLADDPHGPTGERPGGGPRRSVAAGPATTRRVVERPRCGHDAAAVRLDLAAENPQPNPRSGKLRHVIGMPSAAPPETTGR